MESSEPEHADRETQAGGRGFRRKDLRIRRFLGKELERGGRHFRHSREGPFTYDIRSG